VPALAVAAVIWWLAASRGDPSLLEDLHIYRGAIQLASTGASLYDYQGVGPFTYPPFAAVVMWPLVQLPAAWLDAVWTLGTFVAGAVAAVVLVTRLPRSRFTWLGPTPSRGALSLMASAATIVVITSVPLLINLWLGQISAVLTVIVLLDVAGVCLLYTSPSPRDRTRSRMPASA
jgi:alpha-1,2-mannosyltransferase